MSGTALYRALVHAGAPEEEAKEAASELDTIHSDISELKITVAELKITSRLNLGVSLIILAFVLKLSFG